LWERVEGCQAGPVCHGLGGAAIPLLVLVLVLSAGGVKLQQGQQTVQLIGLVVLLLLLLRMPWQLLLLLLLLLLLPVLLTIGGISKLQEGLPLPLLLLLIQGLGAWWRGRVLEEVQRAAFLSQGAGEDQPLQGGGVQLLDIVWAVLTSRVGLQQ
jgi:hypothetical protein